MIKKTITALVLFSVVGFSLAAEAKLTKIGTVTIAKTALGESGRMGGPGMGGGEAPISNEYGLIYEDDQDLVWIDYSSGSKEWPEAVKWAKALNDAGALTYNFNPGVNVAWNGDWRLPDVKDGARKNGFDGSTTAGFNITTSEMGHLFYASLGNPAYYDKAGNVQQGFAGLKNKGPFQNLKADTYWTGTQYAINTIHAWTFNFYYGSQDFNSFTNSYAYPGLAVRSGKVTTSGQ